MALAGKTFVIFGGSSGMGKSAAKEVVRRGGVAWIVGRDHGRLSDAVSEITAGHEADFAARVRTSAVDASDVKAVESFFNALPDGSIHGIVSTIGPSAGVGSIAGSDGFDGLRRQFDLKFFAQVAAVSFGTSKVADGGAIVLCSGALSRRPGKGSTALAAANAAVEAIVRGLANDLGPRLRINCVSPGLTNTEMWAKMPAENRNAMLNGFGATLPLGRAGEPDDVGHAVAFLLENTYITGSTIDVDGGAVIRK